MYNKNMDFKNKNFYFIDSQTPVESTILTKRLRHLGGQQVNLNTKKIDYLIYDIKAKHSTELVQRFMRLKKNNLIVLSPDELLKAMGFNPNPAYIDWETYPNFDPWTGKKLSLWQN